jgi:hypothetical protein
MKRLHVSIPCQFVHAFWKIRYRSQIDHSDILECFLQIFHNHGRQLIGANVEYLNGQSAFHCFPQYTHIEVGADEILQFASGHHNSAAREPFGGRRNQSK